MWPKIVSKSAICSTFPRLATFEECCLLVCTVVHVSGGFNGSSKGHCAGVFTSVYVLIAHNQKV